MSGTVDISLLSLLVYIALLTIPAVVLWHWGLLDISRDMAVSVVRMTVQMLLVGLYLKFLFEKNNLWLNLTWLLVMLVVANISIVRRAGLSVRRFFVATQDQSDPHHCSGRRIVSADTGSAGTIF